MSEILPHHIKHEKELGYTIVAEPDEYRVEYKIYVIEGWGDGDTPGVYDRPLWHRAGANSSPDPVETLKDAELYLHGSVKWDGCSNWWFDEQDRGTMMHGCSKEDLENIGKIMAVCWDWIKELCLNWMD